MAVLSILMLTICGVLVAALWLLTHLHNNGYDQEHKARHAAVELAESHARLQERELDDEGTRLYNKFGKEVTYYDHH